MVWVISMTGYAVQIKLRYEFNLNLAGKINVWIFQIGA